MQSPRLIHVVEADPGSTAQIRVNLHQGESTLDHHDFPASGTGTTDVPLGASGFLHPYVGQTLQISINEVGPGGLLGPRQDVPNPGGGFDFVISEAAPDGAESVSAVL